MSQPNHNVSWGTIVAVLMAAASFVYSYAVTATKVEALQGQVTELKLSQKEMASQNTAILEKLASIDTRLGLLLPPRPLFAVAQEQVRKKH